MVGQKCRGVTGSFGGWRQIIEAGQQIISVFMISKYIPALDTANDDMVEQTR
jgi:hypothetical protein